MYIKTTTVLKHPTELVWITTRDRLPEIVPLLDDIDSVTVQSREERVRRDCELGQRVERVPEAFSHGDLTRPSGNARVERPCEVVRRDFECKWRIEPHFLR